MVRLSSLAFIIVTLIWTNFPEYAIGQDLKLGELRGGGGGVCSRLDVSNSYSDNSYSEPTLRCGPGLLAEAGLSDQLVLELGVFYNRYHFVRAFETHVVDESVRRIHVPLVFKMWPSRYFYGGLGFYASYRLGSVNSAAGVVVEDQRTSAHDTGEHGLEATLGTELAFNKRADSFFRIEYRHSFSLTPRPLEARNYQQILLGVLFPIKD